MSKGPGRTQKFIEKALVALDAGSFPLGLWPLSDFPEVGADIGRRAEHSLQHIADEYALLRSLERASLFPLNEIRLQQAADRGLGRRIGDGLVPHDRTASRSELESVRRALWALKREGKVTLDHRAHQGRSQLFVRRSAPVDGSQSAQVLADWLLDPDPTEFRTHVPLGIAEQDLRPLFELALLSVSGKFVADARETYTARMLSAPAEQDHASEPVTPKNVGNRVVNLLTPTELDDAFNATTVEMRRFRRQDMTLSVRTATFLVGEHDVARIAEQLVAWYRAQRARTVYESRLVQRTDMPRTGARRVPGTRT